MCLHTNDKYILNIVKGYRIQISDQPIQTIVSINPKFNIQDCELIDEEINKIFKIKAIVESNHEENELISDIFQ